MYSGSPAEKRIALIPRVVVQGKMGLNEYALLVTDKRSILVLEKGSKSGIAGALGGAVGAAIANAAASRKSFDLLPLIVRSLILDLHPENGTKEGLLQLYQFQGVVWNDDILRIDRERFRILILIIKGFSRGCRVCDCSTNSASQCACYA